MAETVLITGGCGFIGRRVARELVDAGYAVRVLDSLIDQVHGQGECERVEGVDYRRGDVRDAQAVDDALEGVDHVIHLAAEVGVGQSMYELPRYVGANDLGTAVLLDRLLAQGVHSIVVASSMSVYGEGAYATHDGEQVHGARRRRRDVEAGRWEPLDGQGRPLRPVATDEQKPVDLSSIYALTKYVQERAVLICAEAYGLHAAALRLFNVFGPGQALSNPYTGVLANFAARLANGQRPMVFEDGLQLRDFVHVEDVARAFRLAMEQPGVSGHVVNIGSGRPYSIREVAGLLEDEMGASHLQPEILRQARSGDIRHCFGDISKAHDLLGYQPQRHLADSLGEFVAWVRATPAADRMGEMKQELQQRGLVT